MDEISFEELRKIHLQEKHSSVLSPLSEAFFDTYLKYMEQFYSELKGGFSMEGAKTFENCKTVFMELVRLRCQKLVLKSFKDSRTNSIDTDGLTTQEKTLYLTLLKSFSNYESSLSVSLAAKKKPPISIVLEILQDVPEFVSQHGKSIGPFTIGATIQLDEETSQLLIEKQVAKRV